MKTQPVNKPVETHRAQSLTNLANASIYLIKSFKYLKNKTKIKKLKNNLKITNRIVLFTLILIVLSPPTYARASSTEWLKLYAHSQLMNSKEFYCLDALWTKESHWNHKAANKRSTAKGIPQILGLKTKDPIKQIDKGLEYIRHRYLTPCRAWRHWQNSGGTY